MCFSSVYALDETPLSKLRDARVLLELYCFSSVFFCSGERETETERERERERDILTYIAAYGLGFRV